MNIIKPKLTAIIRTSGVKSPVKWIDLDEGICKTEGGYEAPIDRFVFVDERDYDSLRGEYAGRAMQAITGGMMQSTLLMEQYAARAGREGYRTVAELIAADSVGYADALINELKREHDPSYYGIVVKSKQED